MIVVYETVKPRYLVQEKDSFQWVNYSGYHSQENAIGEADKLQDLFPDTSYRVVDTA